MITLQPKTTGGPFYLQIYRQLKDDIRRGVLPARLKLPSKRKLAAQLNISVNTVDAAYSQLVSEGFIQAAPQKGYFICALDELAHDGGEKTPPRPSPAADPAVKVDFSAGGSETEKFPFATWRKIMRKCLNEFDARSLRSAPPQGDPALREAIAAYLYQARGVQSSAEQIVVGAGTDNSLQTLSYILQRHFTIAMEDPVYNKAYRLFNGMGHCVLPVPIDAMGIAVEPLADLYNTAVYITPSHQFPLGTSMPISRRIKLLNWACRGVGRYIIEDDYDSEFRYSTRPIAALQSIDKNEKVVYLGTFSKVIAPSLRISYLALPPPLLAAYRRCCSFGSAVSRFDQSVLNEFIRGGHFETHLNKMRTLYKNRRSHLVRALGECGDAVRISGDDAGHHLLIQLTTGLSEAEMCRRAAAAGARVYPISPYFIGGMPARHHGKVLLGYGALNNDQISEGVRLLRRAWAI